jgi:hypothetical protein
MLMEIGIEAFDLVAWFMGLGCGLQSRRKYEENVVTSFKLNLLLMIFWFYIINSNS